MRTVLLNCALAKASTAMSITAGRRSFLRQAGSDLRGSQRFTCRISRLKGGSGGTGHGKPPAQKKRARGWGGRYLRYSASEKYQMIRLLESSSLSFRRLDIHRSTFCHWLQRYQDNGVDGLEDRKPTPTVAWWLCTSMSASDVSDTLGDALCFAGLDQVKVRHKPRLLSDNGPC